MGPKDFPLNVNTFNIIDALDVYIALKWEPLKRKAWTNVVQTYSNVCLYHIVYSPRIGATENSHMTVSYTLFEKSTVAVAIAFWIADIDKNSSNMQYTYESDRKTRKICLQPIIINLPK